MGEKKRFVCDTSVIVDGRIIGLVNDGTVSGTICIPNASIAELEHQANSGKETGFAGLGVLKKLREMESTGEAGIHVSIEGSRPTPSQIEYAKRGGEIDASIRRMAYELGAVLVTGDKVQNAAAEVEGVKTLYLHAKEEAGELSFMRYFGPDTMSVHFKENCVPVAKQGRPGEVRIIEMGSTRMGLDEIRAMSDEIVEATKRNSRYYTEIEKRGSTVIQLAEYRIVMNKPPFSDGFEITIVRPVRQLRFKDYAMSEKLRERIDKSAEGIIICGPPGSGKSTFAAALAEYYYLKKKVVKTMESPRDLRVPDEVTQYTMLDGDFDNTKEVLLLVRPDYTFYDEMRKTRDFEIYADMRMAGIGLVGVVHGRKAIDAVQRFINKIELGMIPQVVDTIILIDKGQVGKTYELRHTVRVPSGMRDADLARPVVEVLDFESGELEYEIYKFGEETVVLPIKGLGGRGGRGRRGQDDSGGRGGPNMDMPIERVISRYASEPFSVERTGRGFVVNLTRTDMHAVMKQGLKRLKRLEEKYGRIELREME